MLSYVVMNTIWNSYGGFMSYKIIVDSCCELTDDIKKRAKFESIPLILQVGDEEIIDDKDFNQKEFLDKVAACPNCPKSSCPSPESFMEAYNCEEEEIYVITLSSHLSGSYNSAELGKSLYEEKYGDKKIYVVDSETASCGELQMAERIVECKEQGVAFEDIIRDIEEYKVNVKTYFVLDNLETMRKNGRMSNVKALVASTLNIKPVLIGNRGVIEQRGQAIGINKALAKMADGILSEVPNPQERILMVAHCNCQERAEYMVKLMKKRADYRKIVIIDTAGISSMYASDGGVIVTL